MSSVKARFIIQIAGKPEEKVVEALDIVLKKLNEGTKFKVLESEKEDVTFDEEAKIYSGFIEVLAKFEDARTLLGFIMDYTPSSIEIEDPSTLKFDSSTFTGILNDMSNYMLRAQGQIRQLSAQAYMMDKKIKELTQNTSNPRKRG